MIRAYAETHPDAALDPRRRLGDGRLPGRYADRGRPRRRRARPAGVPAQPRPPRRLGEHPGAGARRHHPRVTRPAARALRARRRTGTRPARCTRARCTSSSRHAAGHVGRGLLPRSARRPGLPALARASPAGRTRSSATTRGWTTRVRRTSRAAQRGDLTAHVVGALWWDRDRGDEQVASLVERRAELHPRPVPGDQRQGDAGRRRRERHRRADRAVPRPVRARRPTTAATPSSTRRRCKPYVARLDAEGFQVHVHGIGDRGVREALDAFAATRPRRDRAPHRPPPAGAPRRRTPLRASSAWPPTCRRCGPASTTRWST